MEVGPSVTLFSELAAEPLEEMLQRTEVRRFFATGRFGLSLAMLDLSGTRARCVRMLEQQGVDVTAWLVLHERDGYWLNADNAPAARERWGEVERFADQHGLRLSRVGLDIEPPRGDMDAVMARDPRALVAVFRRRRSREALGHAQTQYAELTARIRASGRSVEEYCLPPLLDESRAATSFLQRVLGLVAADADDRVPMAYSSYLGRALTASYARGSRCVALGVTGGGVYAERDTERVLGWSRVRDEMNWAASHGAERLYLFSLEGCVEQGMLSDLAAWQPGEQPSWRLRTLAGDALRAGLRAALRAAELGERTHGALSREALRIPAHLTSSERPTA